MKSGELSFTEKLWRQIDAIFAAILAHPFIKGLSDGSLDRECFKFYVIQDSLYLREYARALSLAAARAPEDSWTIAFNEHAKTALEVERALHESFFRDFGLSAGEVHSTAMAPTNLAYTSYLLAVAYSRPFHELLAALLPCYWIYWEVGKRLAETGSPDPLYQRWMETYAADSFAAVVRVVLDMADALGESLNEDQRAAAGRHFVTTSRYEWMFWEMGLRREEWPV